VLHLKEFLEGLPVSVASKEVISLLDATLARGLVSVASKGVTDNVLVSVADKGVRMQARWDAGGRTLESRKPRRGPLPAPFLKRYDSKGLRRWGSAKELTGKELREQWAVVSGQWLVGRKTGRANGRETSQRGVDATLSDRAGAGGPSKGRETGGRLEKETKVWRG
jgi:hypothetical protein